MRIVFGVICTIIKIGITKYSGLLLGNLREASKGDSGTEFIGQTRIFQIEMSGEKVIRVRGNHGKSMEL